MLTQTQIQIIEYLINREEPNTIRGIARDLKKSYALTYNNIEDLKQREIIIKQKIPPAQIIKLNPNANQKYLLAAERKRKEDFLTQHKWAQVFLTDMLKNTKQAYFTLLIFGSHAKQKMNKKSDLDILAIVPDKKDIDILENSISNTYTKIKKQIFVVTQRMFKEMIQKSHQSNIGNEAKKHHIILYGIEQYYQLIKNE